MKYVLRLTALVLAVLSVMSLPALAYEAPGDFSGLTLEQVMVDYMEENGLNESNFSVSYYNVVTGEAYAFNDGAFMVAGSTFKLPLNMYYYEMERDGEIAPDAYIEGAGTTLDDAHRKSLVDSNNEVSIGMLYNLGEFKTYKQYMRKYFTMTDEEIDYVYYVDNYYCTRMMMDALQYLYDHSGDFEEMLGYMKQAQPDQYFRAYVTDYEVAHKYGWFEGSVNDVGIIYTPQPFLLAVYTQDTYEGIVSEVAALLTAYNTWHAPAEPETPAAEPEMPEELPAAEPEEPAANPQEPVEEPAEEAVAPAMVPEEATPNQPEAPRKPAPWLLFMASGVVLLAVGAVILATDPNRTAAKYRRRYGDRAGSGK